MTADFSGLIGIDLGTTYSCIAHLRPDGTPQTIPNREGDLVTPSAVFVEDDIIIIGREAKRAGALAPERTAVCMKRDMGSPAFSHEVAGEKYRPEVLSALVLKRLKEDAEAKVGNVTDAVITVPAYFDDTRRKATQNAGKLAGLNVLDIINEPTAAALAYAFDSHIRQFDDSENFVAELEKQSITALVYDLGGGTFDVPLVRMSADRFETLATDGDVQLGGRDWDERLVNYMAEQFIEEHGSDPREDPESLAFLYQVTEEAKHALSVRKTTRVLIMHDGKRMGTEITRELFEELTADLLLRTETTTELVIDDASLKWDDVDRVLLVGGMTRTPQVRTMLQRLTGKEPDGRLAADEAVAHGAAIHGGIRLSQAGPIAAEARTEFPKAWTKFSTVDVNSHSLGIAVASNDQAVNSILIPKNTPLPITRAKLFKTHFANQRYCRVTVLEGEAEEAEACTKIGEFDIENLPPDLPAGSPVEIQCSYGSDGRISVIGKDLTSDQAAQTTIHNAAGMQDAELAREFDRLSSLQIG